MMQDQGKDAKIFFSRKIATVQILKRKTRNVKLRRGTVQWFKVWQRRNKKR